MNQIPRDQAERIAKKVFDQRWLIVEKALGAANKAKRRFQEQYIRLMADLIQEKE